MSTARRLRIPRDVGEAIGVDLAARLVAGPWPAGYRCVTCGVRGTFDGGELAVAGLDVFADGTQRLWIQHARCGQGGVVERVGPAPSVEHLDDGITVVAGIEPAAVGGAWPFLLVELAAVAIARQGGDQVDLAVGAAVGQGLQPVADLTQPPPAVPGWRVVLPRDDRPGGVYDPAGGGFVEPLPVLTGAWADAVQHRGARCGVYLTSQVGLQRLLGNADPNHLVAAVLAAGRAGRLIGVTADVET